MRRTIVETPWTTLAPFRAPDEEEIFAIGDVHGQAEPLALMLAHIAAIPRQLARRRIVFLGDVIDRGPQSVKSMELVLEAERLAVADDCTFLPGNHELMLLDALSDVDDFHLWFQNGGGAVLEEIDPDTRIDVKDRGRVLERLRSALPWTFLKLVERAPSHLRRGDLLFVHAGLNPLEDPDCHLAQTGRRAGGRHWAWIRDDFLDWRGGWGGVLVIHGHTPALVGSGPHDQDAVSAALDHRADLARICLDAQAARRPRVAALQVAEPRYRLIVCDVGAHEVDPGHGFFAI